MQYSLTVSEPAIISSLLDVFALLIRGIDFGLPADAYPTLISFFLEKSIPDDHTVPLSIKAWACLSSVSESSVEARQSLVKNGLLPALSTSLEFILQHTTTTAQSLTHLCLSVEELSPLFDAVFHCLSVVSQCKLSSTLFRSLRPFVAVVPVSRLALVLRLSYEIILRNPVARECFFVEEIPFMLDDTGSPVPTRIGQIALVLTEECRDRIDKILAAGLDEDTLAPHLAAFHDNTDCLLYLLKILLRAAEKDPLLRTTLFELNPFSWIGRWIMLLSSNLPPLPTAHNPNPPDTALTQIISDLLSLLARVPETTFARDYLRTHSFPDSPPSSTLIHTHAEAEPDALSFRLHDLLTLGHPSIQSRIVQLVDALSYGSERQRYQLFCTDIIPTIVDVTQPHTHPLTDTAIHIALLDTINNTLWLAANANVDALGIEGPNKRATMNEQLFARVVLPSFEYMQFVFRSQHLVSDIDLRSQIGFLLLKLNQLAPLDPSIEATMRALHVPTALVGFLVEEQDNVNADWMFEYLKDALDEWRSKGHLKHSHQAWLSLLQAEGQQNVLEAQPMRNASTGVSAAVIRSRKLLRAYACNIPRN
ncbi:hypothetical protein BLNAU_15526 [Blattamonas nauphoetae]|uniref:Uncharacterized protein n=1 Tax=Blattamonas nauphoetae TaxID=2049346 RepID=A0ABQ9XDR8_9EUKA|nr:hypothetical protein BLNAU_15526 [Blattamonas nauphoetae]